MKTREQKKNKNLTEAYVYTRQEFAVITQDAKDGKPDARKYIIIDNKVYDVTEFVEDHPGGADVLLTHVGKDASGKENINSFSPSPYL